MQDTRDHQSFSRSWRFWAAALLAFASVMILTMLKDWWLTSEEPNVLFYVFVPLLSMLGGVFGMYGAARVSRQAISFLALLAISLGANIGLQVVENLAKVVYYRVWQYPGMLYVATVLPLGVLLLAYGLIRWGKIRMRMAAIMAITDLAGSIVVATLLSDVVGLTTPGS